MEVFDEKLNISGLSPGEVTGWLYRKFLKIFLSSRSMAPRVKMAAQMQGFLRALR